VINLSRSDFPLKTQGQIREFLGSPDRMHQSFVFSAHEPAGATAFVQRVTPAVGTLPWWGEEEMEVGDTFEGIEREGGLHRNNAQQSQRQRKNSDKALPVLGDGEAHTLKTLPMLSDGEARALKTIYAKGSDWFVLSALFCRLMLKHQRVLRDALAPTWFPSEAYVQSLTRMLGSSAASLVVNDDLRHIIWDKKKPDGSVQCCAAGCGCCHPCMQALDEGDPDYTKKVFTALLKNPWKLFVRKCSMERTKERLLIEFLSDHLNKTRKAERTLEGSGSNGGGGDEGGSNSGGDNGNHISPIILGTSVGALVLEQLPVTLEGSPYSSFGPRAQQAIVEMSGGLGASSDWLGMNSLQLTRGYLLGYSHSLLNSCLLRDGSQSLSYFEERVLRVSYLQPPSPSSTENQGRMCVYVQGLKVAKELSNAVREHCQTSLRVAWMQAQQGVPGPCTHPP
jgi:hypothetical protein